ncbi:membrane-bound alpha-1,6- mannosyltransferase Initiation-specific [Rhizoclosmatium hyalinum]|nr:membrane-bound alpha-1,6- mannosyltransferase Initiation-specific [Rhizoclosmatium hyalinum]
MDDNKQKTPAPHNKSPSCSPIRRRRRLTFLIALFILALWFWFQTSTTYHHFALPTDTDLSKALIRTVTVTKTVTETYSNPTARPSPEQPHIRQITNQTHLNISSLLLKSSVPITQYTKQIPNLILRTWKTSSRSDIFNLNTTKTNTSDIPAWFQSWDTLNPQHVQLIFSDSESDRFVEGFFSSWVVQAYYRLPRTVMRSDLVRYLLLYYFGGIYTDMDTQCLQPIYKWTAGRDGVSVLIGVENARGRRDNLNQWTIGAAAGHPLLAMVVWDVVNGIHKLSDEELRDPGRLLYITGPGVWKPAVYRYLEEVVGIDGVRDVSFLWDGERLFDDIMILGKTLLSPLNPENPKALSIHYGTGKLEGGWKTISDTSILYIPNHLSSLRSYELFEQSVEGWTHKPLLNSIVSSKIPPTSNNIQIPKQIAQIWWTSDSSLLSSFYQRIQSSWIHLNPGYTYTLFDDTKMDAWIKKYASDHEKKVYFKAGLLHQRVGVFKILWLIKSGGVFADIDTECLHPIDTWRLAMDGVGLAVGIQNQIQTPLPHIAKHTILSAPNHSLLVSYFKTRLAPFISSTSKKQLRATLPYKLLHHDWFDAHIFAYLREKGGIDLPKQLPKCSWECIVRVGDVVLYGQSMFRPDDLDRNISLVKNYDLLWHRDRTWSVGWPELEVEEKEEGHNEKSK